MLRLNSKKAIPRHLPILRRSALQLHALYHGISSQIPFFQGQGSRPTTASNLNFLHQFPLTPELPANLFHQLFLISAHKNFQSPNPPIPLTNKFVDFFLQLFPAPRFYHQQPLVIFSVSVVSPVLLQPLFHIFSHTNFHRFFAKFQHVHASLNSFFSHLLATKKLFTHTASPVLHVFFKQQSQRHFVVINIHPVSQVVQKCYHQILHRHRPVFHYYVPVLLVVAALVLNCCRYRA